MDHLPRELTDIIISNVSRSDLKRLRQVSKRLSDSATRQLFSRIHVKGELASQDKYNSIISSPRLSKYVTNIYFEPDNGAYDLRFVERLVVAVAQCDLTFEAEHKTRVQGFKTIIKKIPDFLHSTIHTISLAFSPKEQARLRENGLFRRDPAATDVKHQIVMLTTLFTSLLPIVSLRSLTLHNIHSIKDELDTLPSTVPCVLGRLTELRVQIAAGLRLYTIPERTTFFTQLPSTLLCHSPNLTSLNLSCDQDWGFVFGCDFRSLHLPNLKMLRLGKYVISHDSQLDWILSHGNTLKELVFNDVVILSYAYGIRDPDPEDNNNAIALTHDAINMTHAWAYPRFWLNILPRFVDELPQLRHFVLDSEEGIGIVANRYKAFYIRHVRPFTDLGQFVHAMVDSEYEELFEWDWRRIHWEADEKAYDEVCRFEIL